MKRLTKREGIVRFVDYANGGVRLDPSEMDAYNNRIVLEKLAEYEDLEEKGLMLKLPCKLEGDTVYTLNKLSSGRMIISEVQTDAYFMTLCVAEGRFGKTVFLTPEEAKEALDKEQWESNKYD